MRLGTTALRASEYRHDSQSKGGQKRLNTDDYDKNEDNITPDANSWDIEGSLQRLKKGVVFRNWINEWVVIQQNFLVCFVSNICLKVKLCIALSTIMVCEPIRGSADNRFHIIYHLGGVENSTAEVIFKASSKDDMSFWLTKIEQVQEAYRTQERPKDSTATKNARNPSGKLAFMPYISREEAEHAIAETRRRSKKKVFATGLKILAKVIEDDVPNRLRLSGLRKLVSHAFLGLHVSVEGSKVQRRPLACRGLIRVLLRVGQKNPFDFWSLRARASRAEEVATGLAAVAIANGRMETSGAMVRTQMISGAISLTHLLQGLFMGGYGGRGDAAWALRSMRNAARDSTARRRAAVRDMIHLRKSFERLASVKAFRRWREVNNQLRLGENLIQRVIGRRINSDKKLGFEQLARFSGFNKVFQTSLKVSDTIKWYGWSSAFHLLERLIGHKIENHIRWSMRTLSRFEATVFKNNGLKLLELAHQLEQSRRFEREKEKQIDRIARSCLKIDFVSQRTEGRQMSHFLTCLKSYRKGFVLKNVPVDTPSSEELIINRFVRIVIAVQNKIVTASLSSLLLHASSQRTFQTTLLTRPPRSLVNLPPNQSAIFTSINPWRQVALFKLSCLLHKRLHLVLKHSLAKLDAHAVEVGSLAYVRPFLLSALLPAHSAPPPPKYIPPSSAFEVRLPNSAPLRESNFPPSAATGDDGYASLNSPSSRQHPNNGTILDGRYNNHASHHYLSPFRSFKLIEAPPFDASSVSLIPPPRQEDDRQQPLERKDLADDSQDEMSPPSIKNAGGGVMNKNNNKSLLSATTVPRRPFSIGGDSYLSPSITYETRQISPDAANVLLVHDGSPSLPPDSAYLPSENVPLSNEVLLAIYGDACDAPKEFARKTAFLSPSYHADDEIVLPHSNSMNTDAQPPEFDAGTISVASASLSLHRESCHYTQKVRPLNDTEPLFLEKSPGPDCMTASGGSQSSKNGAPITPVQVRVQPAMDSLRIQTNHPPSSIGPSNLMAPSSFQSRQSAHDWDAKSDHSTSSMIAPQSVYEEPDHVLVASPVLNRNNAAPSLTSIGGGVPAPLAVTPVASPFYANLSRREPVVLDSSIGDLPFKGQIKEATQKGRLNEEEDGIWITWTSNDVAEQSDKERIHGKEASITDDKFLGLKKAINTNYNDNTDRYFNYYEGDNSGDNASFDNENVDCSESLSASSSPARIVVRNDQLSSKEKIHVSSYNRQSNNDQLNNNRFYDLSNCSVLQKDDDDDDESNSIDKDNHDFFNPNHMENNYLENSPQHFNQTTHQSTFQPKSAQRFNLTSNFDASTEREESSPGVTLAKVDYETENGWNGAKDETSDGDFQHIRLENFRLEEQSERTKNELYEEYGFKITPDLNSFLSENYQQQNLAQDGNDFVKNEENYSSMRSQISSSSSVTDSSDDDDVQITRMKVGSHFIGHNNTSNVEESVNINRINDSELAPVNSDLHQFQNLLFASSSFANPTADYSNYMYDTTKQLSNFRDYNGNQNSLNKFSEVSSTQTPLPQLQQHVHSRTSESLKHEDLHNNTTDYSPSERISHKKSTTQSNENKITELNQNYATTTPFIPQLNYQRHHNSHSDLNAAIYTSSVPAPPRLLSPRISSSVANSGSVVSSPRHPIEPVGKFAPPQPVNHRQVTGNSSSIPNFTSFANQVNFAGSFSQELIHTSNENPPPFAIKKAKIDFEPPTMMPSMFQVLASTEEPEDEVENAQQNAKHSSQHGKSWKVWNPITSQTGLKGLWTGGKKRKAK